MIEMTKWFKMEQVVKGTWFAAILTSGFTNSNDGRILATSIGSQLTS